jgi:PEP-CTERM motif
MGNVIGLRTLTSRLPLIVFFGLVITTHARAGMIPVVDAGFEDEVLGVGNSISVAPGWVLGNGGGGILHPDLSMFPGGAPEGLNVAFSNGGYFSQTLAAVLELGTYSLMVDVGRRGDNTPFGGYTIQLLAGSVVLAEDNDTLIPPAGTFLTSIITYDATARDPNLGQSLTIVLTSLGVQTNFDDVRLSLASVPEPGSLLTLGIGAAFVLGYARRRGRNASTNRA